MELRAVFIKTWRMAIELIESNTSEATKCMRELLRHLGALGKKAKSLIRISLGHTEASHQKCGLPLFPSYKLRRQHLGSPLRLAGCGLGLWKRCSLHNGHLTFPTSHFGSAPGKT